MPFPRSGFRRFATLAVAAMVIFLLLPPGFAGRRWSERERHDGPPGNLAVISFKLYEVGVAGVRHQMLARVLVENQSPLDLESPFRVLIGRAEATPAAGGRGIFKRKPRPGSAAVGSCRGELLPRGQVAICDIWLQADLLAEGEEIAARLDRSLPGYAAWDGDPSNDQLVTRLRTTTPGRSTLRIAKWDVRPRILHGMGEVQFRFTVEGAHLAWLLSENEKEPRLVAGHPADGLLSGNGTIKIRESGPLTLVARNSLGAFVYETIPVLNSYEPPQNAWHQAPAAAVDAEATARILDPGVYDEDDNRIILDNLASYLAAKDWAVELERLRRLGEEDKPLPASVLNPKARDR
ncbi:MAG: hypothetical protein Q9Q40_03750 [Acidobacteriota bacterium]|nr:hypothetical protein [Acidobacteriota bacterium]MDQ7088657.1 hypothetical protein [Acidobacteriota bacterium]